VLHIEAPERVAKTTVMIRIAIERKTDGGGDENVGPPPPPTVVFPPVSSGLCQPPQSACFTNHYQQSCEQNAWSGGE
jgi:hypothetical protein